jgi:hypothetical protein
MLSGVSLTFSNPEAEALSPMLERRKEGRSGGWTITSSEESSPTALRLLQDVLLTLMSLSFLGDRIN